MSNSRVYRHKAQTPGKRNWWLADLRSVLHGKRFGLLHSALEAIRYTSVAVEASSSFSLVEWMKSSGGSTSHVRPPALHVSSFETMAASYSARTIASINPSHDADLDVQVWEATLAEVAEGPYDVTELPSGHVVSPRFGVRWSAKVRLIDNLSVSGLISTVGLPE